MPVDPGQQLAHYRLIEKIGEGGMGVVWLAEDLALGRKVALKFLAERSGDDPGWRTRLLREARSAAALDHPYVCKVYETGELDGQAFIAMEYVRGQTLAERLREGALSLKDAVRMAHEIAEALADSHREQVVHRDLKPANVMLARDGHVKVMDFGLAKRLAAAETLEGQQMTLSATLTAHGTLLGTLA